MNVDDIEINKFSQVAHKWWDKDSEFKPLHDINPLRLDFIEQHAPLAGKTVVDVGCGGGILSEGMAARGANVTGIDLAEKSIGVAKLHLHESQLNIDYQCIASEDYAEAHPESADIVTCLELLEHVPDYASIVNACANIVKPGGWVFFSTLNRNPSSYAQAIIGAEYILRMLTPGTHDYARFIKPSELIRALRHSGLESVEIKGMGYHLFEKTYFLRDDVSVNYLLAARRPL